MISATLVQLIQTAGRRPLRVEQARFAAEAARYDLFAAGREAALKIDALLLDLAFAQARLSALEAQIAVEGELVDAAEKRLRVGLGSSVELATVRASHRKAVLDRQATTAAMADALNELAIATGLPADQLPLRRLLLPRLGRTLPDDFTARVRTAAPLNRADLLARLADYGAADTELGLQLAGRTPDIGAGPGFEYDKGDQEWGIALTATLPVFNHNGGAIGQAAAQRRQAETQFTTTQAAVIGEVEKAAKAYGQALQAMAVAERLYADQAQRARAQEVLFARGEIDRVEVLTARAELAVEFAARVGAQVAVDKAALAVEAAGQLNADGFDPVSLISPDADH
jgi:outer membrane protein TolC